MANNIAMAFTKISSCRNFAGSSQFLRIKGACFKLFNSNINTRIMYEMKTAHFQHYEGEEKVYINVNFSDFKINKVFNFERNILDKVDVFITRLDSKLLNVFEKKKKQNKLPQDLHPNGSVLLVNDAPLPDNTIFQELFSCNFDGNLKLRILGNDYEVLINSPFIKKMTLPKKLIPECVTHAEVFEAKFVDESESEFIWFRSENINKPKSWEQCGEGFFYKIRKEDVNYHLKLLCKPKSKGKVGPSYEVVSDTPVANFENFGEIQKRHKFTMEKTKPDELRIVSYNILSDVYVNTKDGKTVLFVFCDSEYLDINYRKSLLNYELQFYNADIICLQEVDRNFYKLNLLLLFTGLGYDCLYYEKEGSREGCLLMYDRSKFNALSSTQYVFTKELLSNPLLNDMKVKIEGNQKLMQRLLSLSSQIQVAVLEGCNKEIVIVGNTHLYFHPDADHIRLLQGIIAWKILLDTAKTVKEREPNKRVSIILCGDLNSTPDSGFHQLLLTGAIGADHVDWKSKEDEAVDDITFKHSLNMKTAYSSDHFTNYTPLFKGCLDYIYFESDNLELKQVVPIPGEDVLSRYSGIPSKFFPSDHVALVADLKFKAVH